MKEYTQKLLLKIAGKLSQVVAKIHAPWTRKKITQIDYEEMMKILKVGDIITTKTNGELSNPLVPGFWGHVGIYDGNGKVVEATTHNVVHTNLAWFLTTKDYVAVSRAKFLTEEQNQAVVDYCIKQVGKKYDFSFNTSDIEKFYCSELIYMGIQTVTGQSPFKLNKILGQDTIAPGDFYEATKLFDRVFKSKSYLEL
jgi:uncharacterized protein YycO